MTLEQERMANQLFKVTPKGREFLKAYKGLKALMT